MLLDLAPARVSQGRAVVLSGAVAASVGAAVSAVFGFAPGLRGVTRGVGVHVAVEMVAVVAAGLVALLVFGRYRQTRRAADLVLTAGLTTLAVSNLAFSVLPAAFPQLYSPAVGWAAPLGRTTGATLFALAAHRRLVARPVGRGASVAAGALLAVGVAAAIGLLVGAVGSPLRWDETAGRHGVLLAGQVLNAGLFAIAAVGLGRRALASDDALLRWFSSGGVLAAFASANYAFYPSLYSASLYSGDALRLGFYLLLLVGAVEEIRAYWRDTARLAVLDERRRIARNLHDGLSHELAFIVTRSSARAAALPLDQDWLQVRSAAQRALDESRRAIAALSRGREETLAEALTEAAENVAIRLGVTLSVDVPDVPTAAGMREELVRITREAITNAGRHGRAQRVAVTVRNDDGTHLTIRDDGSGFDPAAPSWGFGLLSIRERAEALRGSCAIESAPGRGTTVRVWVP